MRKRHRIKKRYCINCGKKLMPPFRNPHQKYCKAHKCQNKRKSLWQKKKIDSDPDYKANQKLSGSSWNENNPGYYKKYRQKNKRYTEKNRIKQRERNKRRRSKLKETNANTSIYSVAKMDALSIINAINSGKYKLVPISGSDPMIAKMDAFIVQLAVITNDSDISTPICKCDCKNGRVHNLNNCNIN
jgi:hypothetical protein